MCANFKVKFAQKGNLEPEIQKTNVGIRISILKIPCVPIFRQNAQLWLFWSKFPQKWILGLQFQKINKINVGIRISILEIPCEIPKFAQKWILGSEFQKSKSGFEISPSNIPLEPIFSQNGQLWIFRSKFGEIAQLRVIFWFEYCWGCCRELDGSWNELGGGGWSWVDVDEAGWRWVYGLVMPFWK